MKNIQLSQDAQEIIRELSQTRAGWIAAGFATCILGLAIPAPFTIAQVTVAAFGAAFTILVIIDHVIEKRARWQWHDAYLTMFKSGITPARITPAIIPTAPEPQDKGKTPTPRFLERLFYYAREKEMAIPSVRDMSVLMGGMDEGEVQMMIVRCVSWGMIVGRVERGKSGQIAETWMYERARQAMARERPEYATWQVVG